MVVKGSADKSIRSVAAMIGKVAKAREVAREAVSIAVKLSRLQEHVPMGSTVMARGAV